ncbi:MAG: WYL domain-containing protein [Cyanobacteriota bacterium]
MTSKPALHPYADRPAFERLMLLLATLVQYPGVGATSDGQDGMTEILSKMQAIALTLHLNLPNYSVHTLRKDLQTLREYGILDRRKHRSGYYLGTGLMTKPELRLAIQALATQAQQLGDPQARRIYEQIERKLRGLDLSADGQILYPVRSQRNQPIVYTDPDEMLHKGHSRRTLFFHLDQLEEAITAGQAVEIFRISNPFGTAKVGHLNVYPLQLIYSEVAWYLLFEDFSTGHLEIERMDRLSDSFKLLPHPPRGSSRQRESLKVAEKLLNQGWGLYLGNPKEQKQERNGELVLTQVKVRFYEPVMTFIQEGVRRHPRQKMRKSQQGDRPCLDYQIELPERSLNEFLRWLNRFMHHVQILKPQELAIQHCENAAALVRLYDQA